MVRLRRDWRAADPLVPVGRGRPPEGRPQSGSETEWQLTSDDFWGGDAGSVPPPVVAPPVPPAVAESSGAPAAPMPPSRRRPGPTGGYVPLRPGGYIEPARAEPEPRSFAWRPRIPNLRALLPRTRSPRRPSRRVLRRIGVCGVAAAVVVTVVALASGSSSPRGIGGAQFADVSGSWMLPTATLPRLDLPRLQTYPRRARRPVHRRVHARHRRAPRSAVAVASPTTSSAAPVTSAPAGPRLATTPASSSTTEASTYRASTPPYTPTTYRPVERSTGADSGSGPAGPTGTGAGAVGSNCNPKCS